MRAATTWDDVLVHLMEENPTSDYATLEVWVARYPQFADELGDHFAAAACQEVLDTLATLDEESLRNRAVSWALNHVHALNQTNKPEAAKAAARLSELARAHGMKEEELASECRLSTAFIIKLDKHRIAPFDGIPRECFQVIARVLNESRRRIEETICGPPLAMSRAALRKATTKATRDTETFEQAIRSSDLTKGDQQYWLMLIESARKHA